MTDTEILDFCEASIKERMADGRWNSQPTKCHIGTASITLYDRKDARTLRELLVEARLKQITERLMK